MGRYKFSSWTLHMASIIIFSSLWGISLKEWKGAGVRAGWCLFFALALLIGSTAIVGYGNYLALLHWRIPIGPSDSSLQVLQLIVLWGETSYFMGGARVACSQR